MPSQQDRAFFAVDVMEGRELFLTVPPVLNFAAYPLT